MRVTLMSGSEVLGTAECDNLPFEEGNEIHLRSANGLVTESRRVEEIRDDPSGGKIVRFGGARPVFVFSPA